MVMMIIIITVLGLKLKSGPWAAHGNYVTGRQVSRRRILG